MLSDEEYGARLGEELRRSVPEMGYTGRVPRPAHARRGYVATSVLAVGAVAVLGATQLPRHDGSSSAAGTPPRHVTGPTAEPHDGPPRTPSSGPTGRTTRRTLTFGDLRFAADVTGDAPHDLSFLLGAHLTVPADAERLHLDFPSAQVYLEPDPAPGDPQAYVVTDSCPDTVAGCADGRVRQVVGVMAPGWTHDQLVDLFEHPVDSQGGPSSPPAGQPTGHPTDG